MKIVSALALFLILVTVGIQYQFSNKKNTTNNRGPASVEVVDEAISLQPVFDPHIHLHYDDSVDANVNVLNTFMQETQLEKIFVLSDSFRDTQDASTAARDLRRQKDEYTHNVVSRLPAGAIGLCGYMATWTDGAEVIGSCLAHEKMQGIKARPFDNYHIHEASNAARLSEVLSAHQNRIKYFLIHMVSESIEQESANPSDTSAIESALALDQRDVDTLLDLALRFPRTKFIIAHSFNSYRLVNYTTQKRNALNSTERQTLTSQGRSSIDNVWIETSTAFTARLAGLTDFTNSNRPAADLEQRRSEFISNLISAWRNFGMQYIIFGSDQMLGGSATKIADTTNQMYDTQLSALTDFSGSSGQNLLTDSELEQIIESNWQSLLR